MVIDMGLTSWLLSITSSQDVPFRQPQQLQCTYHGLTFSLLCVPFFFLHYHLGVSDNASKVHDAYIVASVVDNKAHLRLKHEEIKRYPMLGWRHHHAIGNFVMQDSNMSVVHIKLTYT